MPKNFNICPILQEIISWVYKTLLIYPKLPLDPKEPTPSTIGGGLIRKYFCPVSNSDTISSWM